MAKDDKKPIQPEHQPEESTQPTEPQSELGEPGQETPDIEAITAERDDLLARLQRLSADYVNYQKRIQKDLTQTREYANESLIKALLVILDDMDRAIEAGQAAGGGDEEDPLLTGMKLVKEKAMDILSGFGVSQIEAQDKPFDPEHHSAVLQEPTYQVPDKTVIKELQKGYMLKERTIRPAMVVVSKKPDKE